MILTSLFLSCSKKTSSNDNSLLLLLLAYNATKSSAAACNVNIQTTSDTIAYDGTSSYRVCGNISTYSTVSFKKAGNYKITTTDGSVLYTSSGCRSVTDTISLLVSYNTDSTSLTSGTVKTFAVNDNLVVNATRPSATKYSCTGYTVTQSTNASYLLLIEPQ